MILELLVYILNTVIVTVIGAVIWAHFQAWKRAPKQRSLLPLHVMMVSLSQVIFIILGTRAVLDRVDFPVNWYTAAYFVGVGVTLAALAIIHAYQGKKA